MNKERRKALTEMQEHLAVTLEDLESYKDEEQDSLDNMPESLQGTERYEAMEQAVSAIDSAMGSLQEVIDYLLDAVQ